MQGAGVAHRSSRFNPGKAAAIARIAAMPATAAMKMSAKTRISLVSRSSVGGAAAATRRSGIGGDRRRGKVCIVWFKRDLRMDDHPGLVAAASSGFDAVIPLFVFDPSLFRGWSQPYVEALIDAVNNLRLDLRAAGSDLVVRTGSVEDSVQEIVNEFNASDVYTEDEIEEDLAQVVSSTLNCLTTSQAALTKWTSSLDEIPDLDVVPDNYSKYRAMQFSASIPLSTPSFFPSLPNGLNTGKLPAAEEFLRLINHSNEIIFEEDLDSLSLFSPSPKPAKSIRRRPLWLRKLLVWFPRATSRRISCVRDDDYAGYDALYALKTFMKFQINGITLKDKDVSLRKKFDKVFALGTISLRRIHHEAVLCSRSKWISSQAVAAAMEEVKIIEWYRLLHRKTQLQESQSGWKVKAWSWRGYLIQYATCGDEGPAVVLIHGFGAFWKHYRDNIREIASKGNRVWAVTMLGFGRSEKPDLVYTEILWAELLRDFIVQVVGEPVVLVGNSLGGYIATMVSSLWSSLVNSLVLVNAAGIVDSQYQFVDIPENVKRKGVPRASLQVLLFFLQQQCVSAFKLCYPSRSERVDELIVAEALRASFDPGAATVLESMFYLRLPLPLNFLLNQYDKKTLIVQGIFDPLQNAFKKARSLQACCKNVTVSIVNAGHCPHDEVPEELNRIISGWVKDTCSKREDPLPHHKMLDSLECNNATEVSQGTRIRIQDVISKPGSEIDAFVLAGTCTDLSGCPFDQPLRGLGNLVNYWNPDRARIPSRATKRISSLVLLLSRQTPAASVRMETEISNFYVGGSAGYYEKPSLSNLETAKNLFQQLLLGRVAMPDSSKAWSSIGFTLKTIVDGDTEFAVVAESPRCRGQGNGFYVVKLINKKRQSPPPPGNIVLQAMHTPSDLHIHKVAFKLLMESNLFVAAAWNTTHRRNVDLGKESMSYFNSFTAAVANSFARPKIIQLHAFDANTHKIKGDMILSSSKLQAAAAVDEEQYQRVVSRLRSELGKFVILQFPKDIRVLGGTLNINAKVFYEHNPKGLFFHVEMSMPLRLDMRDKPEARNGFIRSFL